MAQREKIFYVKKGGASPLITLLFFSLLYFTLLCSKLYTFLSKLLTFFLKLHTFSSKMLTLTKEKLIFKKIIIVFSLFRRNQYVKTQPSNPLIYGNGKATFYVIQYSNPKRTATPNLKNFLLIIIHIQKICGILWHKKGL